MMPADALSKPKDARSFKRQLSMACWEINQQCQRAKRYFGSFVKDLARLRLYYKDTTEKLISAANFWQESGFLQICITIADVVAEVRHRLKPYFLPYFQGHSCNTSACWFSSLALYSLPTAADADIAWTFAMHRKQNQQPRVVMIDSRFGLQLPQLHLCSSQMSAPFWTH